MESQASAQASAHVGTCDYCLNDDLARVSLCGAGHLACVQCSVSAARFALALGTTHAEAPTTTPADADTQPRLLTVVACPTCKDAGMPIGAFPTGWLSPALISGLAPPTSASLLDSKALAFFLDVQDTPSALDALARLPLAESTLGDSVERVEVLVGAPLKSALGPAPPLLPTLSPSEVGRYTEAMVSSLFSCSDVEMAVKCPNPTCGAMHVMARPAPSDGSGSGGGSGSGVEGPGLGPSSARCLSCDTSMCASCGMAWEDPASKVRHFGMSCAAYAQTLREVDEATALPGRKACPGCSVMLEHSQSHGCHHITCPRCNYQLCFVCLAPHPCPNDCGTHCNSTCDCEACPDCRPGRSCTRCSGGCYTCRGETEASAVTRKALSATARAEKMGGGWCGPRKWAPSARATPGASLVTPSGAVRSLDSMRGLALLPAQRSLSPCMVAEVLRACQQYLREREDGVIQGQGSVRSMLSRAEATTAGHIMTERVHTDDERSAPWWLHFSRQYPDDVQVQTMALVVVTRLSTRSYGAALDVTDLSELYAVLVRLLHRCTADVARNDALDVRQAVVSPDDAFHLVSFVNNLSGFLVGYFNDSRAGYDTSSQRTDGQLDLLLSKHTVGGLPAVMLAGQEYMVALTERALRSLPAAAVGAVPDHVRSALTLLGETVDLNARMAAPHPGRHASSGSDDADWIEDTRLFRAKPLHAVAVAMMTPYSAEVDVATLALLGGWEGVLLEGTTTSTDAHVLLYRKTCSVAALAVELKLRMEKTVWPSAQAGRAGPIFPVPRPSTLYSAALLAGLSETGRPRVRGLPVGMSEGGGASAAGRASSWKALALPMQLVMLVLSMGVKFLDTNTSVRDSSSSTTDVEDVHDWSVLALLMTPTLLEAAPSVAITKLGHGFREVCKRHKALVQVHGSASSSSCLRLAQRLQAGAEKMLHMLEGLPAETARALAAGFMGVPCTGDAALAGITFPLDQCQTCLLQAGEGSGFKVPDGTEARGVRSALATFIYAMLSSLLGPDAVEEEEEEEEGALSLGGVLPAESALPTREPGTDAVLPDPVRRVLAAACTPAASPQKALRLRFLDMALRQATGEVLLVRTANEGSIGGDVESGETKTASASLLVSVCVCAAAAGAAARSGLPPPASRESSVLLAEIHIDSAGALVHALLDGPLSRSTLAPAVWAYICTVVYGDAAEHMPHGVAAIVDGGEESDVGGGVNEGQQHASLPPRLNLEDLQVNGVRYRWRDIVNVVRFLYCVGEGEALLAAAASTGEAGEAAKVKAEAALVVLRALKSTAEELVFTFMRVHILPWLSIPTADWCRRAWGFLRAAVGNGLVLACVSLAHAARTSPVPVDASAATVRETAVALLPAALARMADLFRSTSRHAGLSVHLTAFGGEMLRHMHGGCTCGAHTLAFGSPAVAASFGETDAGRLAARAACVKRWSFLRDIEYRRRYSRVESGELASLILHLMATYLEAMKHYTQGEHGTNAMVHAMGDLARQMCEARCDEKAMAACAQMFFDSGATVADLQPMFHENFAQGKLTCHGQNYRHGFVASLFILTHDPRFAAEAVALDFGGTVAGWFGRYWEDVPHAADPLATRLYTSHMLQACLAIPGASRQFFAAGGLRSILDASGSWAGPALNILTQAFPLLTPLRVTISKAKLSEASTLSSCVLGVECVPAGPSPPDSVDSEHVILTARDVLDVYDVADMTSVYEVLRSSELRDGLSTPPLLMARLFARLHARGVAMLERTQGWDLLDRAKALAAGRSVGVMKQAAAAACAGPASSTPVRPPVEAGVCWDTDRLPLTANPDLSSLGRQGGEALDDDEPVQPVTGDVDPTTSERQRMVNTLMASVTRYSSAVRSALTSTSTTPAEVAAVGEGVSSAMSFFCDAARAIKAQKLYTHIKQDGFSEAHHTCSAAVELRALEKLDYTALTRSAGLGGDVRRHPTTVFTAATLATSRAHLALLELVVLSGCSLRAQRGEYRSFTCLQVVGDDALVHLVEGGDVEHARLLARVMVALAPGAAFYDVDSDPAGDTEHNKHFVTKFTSLATGWGGDARVAESVLRAAALWCRGSGTVRALLEAPRAFLRCLDSAASSSPPTFSPLRCTGVEFLLDTAVRHRGEPGVVDAALALVQATAMSPGCSLAPHVSFNVALPYILALAQGLLLDADGAARTDAPASTDVAAAASVITALHSAVACAGYAASPDVAGHAAQPAAWVETARRLQLVAVRRLAAALSQTAVHANAALGKEGEREASRARVDSARTTLGACCAVLPAVVALLGWGLVDEAEAARAAVLDITAVVGTSPDVATAASRVGQRAQALVLRQVADRRSQEAAACEAPGSGGGGLLSWLTTWVQG